MFQSLTAGTVKDLSVNQVQCFGVLRFKFSNNACIDLMLLQGLIGTMTVSKKD